MPSLASLTGRFDMMSLIARHDDMTVALSAPRTPVAKAMKPLAAVKAEDSGAILARAMRLDAPEANPLAYRTHVMAYTSGM